MPRLVAGTAHAEIANAALEAHVDPAAKILPTRVTGRLPGTPRGTMRDLAVAVNGRIRAVGRSFHLHGRRTEFFSLLVPESALRPGRNEVQVLEVRPGGGLAPALRLRRVGDLARVAVEPAPACAVRR